ncbi:hypothetical protein [Actinomadura macrotermitis]|uniref:Uncharacterized protein n=1 Tax=Actinomadura macrotermitis TaxID=2585200 RepID=A0A7K0BRN5_9ACTN|nr:hypothetical protein [Actinomadura macrotermitis]MQY03865.1 hypothetical protein [Actinomadura macrotermitis]
MKYVIAEWQDDEDYPAYHLDPRPYLAELPALAEALPPGAREFALDPAHYEFDDPHCVKNLTSPVLSFGDGPRPGLTVRLTPNGWTQTEALVIEYSGVSAFSLEVEDQSEEEYPQGLDRVLLDELLPAPSGCTHEIRFTGGCLLVACADLQARWQAAGE